MDDLNVLLRFRAERDVEPPEAREAVRRALEARMEAAARDARDFGEALAESSAPAHSAGRCRGLLSRRRRLLFFVGAAAGAAAVAGVLVLNSGPTAQPASAAEILHRTAAAASEAPPTLVPGAGEFLFRKEQRLEIEGWRHPLPPQSANLPVAGTGGTMSGPDAFNALMPRMVETWTRQNGGGRSREVAGVPQFWSSEEEARWKAAGSPLPPPFDAEYQQRYKSAFRGARELGPRVVDMETRGWGNLNFPDTSKLPTEPEALRRAVEGNDIKVIGFNLMFGKAKHLDAEQTTEELINILQEGEPTPQLQAAIFDALAELPGMAVETEATDGLARHGDAIQLRVKQGIREEYLFDPASGELLASRGVLVDPAAAPSNIDELPAGTTLSERDYIEEATVDSTSETGGEADGRQSAATTASANRR